ncbi:MAG TPA: hypothetical protein PLU25_12755, partial [Acidobacteriota bacterium]|nr:hypothetical protein [Acidobacteriota bacterium]
VYTGRTDKNGVYTLNIIVPEFSAGQAAILVQASSEFGTDELKLKISPHLIPSSPSTPRPAPAAARCGGFRRREST